MRTIGGIRKCGSLRSMRHISTRPYEDKSVPHLTLYVQHMNKTKLMKEREILLNRLGDVEKEIKHIDENILRLRPKLGLPEGKRRGSRKEDNGDVVGDEQRRQKIRTKKMKMAF